MVLAPPHTVMMRASNIWYRARDTVVRFCFELRDKINKCTSAQHSDAWIITAAWELIQKQ